MPDVCVAVPYIQGTLDELRRCIASLKAQDCQESVSIVVVNESELDSKTLSETLGVSVVQGPGDSRHRLGGVLLQIFGVWSNSDAEFVAYANPCNYSAVSRFRLQIQTMRRFSLAGCYGHVLRVDGKGVPELLLEAQTFTPEMIGRNCFSAESMLIDKARFEKAGGFDFAFGAGYRPRAFLSTMAALGGRMHLVDEPVLYDAGGAELLPDTPLDAVDVCATRAKEYWSRIRFERFVSQARAYAETQGWLT